MFRVVEFWLLSESSSSESPSRRDGTGVQVVRTSSANPLIIPQCIPIFKFPGKLNHDHDDIHYMFGLLDARIVIKFKLNSHDISK